MNFLNMEAKKTKKLIKQPKMLFFHAEFLLKIIYPQISFLGCFVHKTTQATQHSN